MSTFDESKGLLNLGGLNGPLTTYFFDNEARPCPGAAAATVQDATPRSLKLALRLQPSQEEAEASPISTLLEVLEDRFLATEMSRGASGNVRTVILSLWSDRRGLLDKTLKMHGYSIKDEREL
jgi:hypothetical protein